MLCPGDLRFLQICLVMVPKAVVSNSLLCRDKLVFGVASVSNNHNLVVVLAYVNIVSQGHRKAAYP